MEQDPGEVLELAYTSFKNGDYAKALKNYGWFYEHVEKIDDTWIGAKYRALNEWGELARKYKPAYETLLIKKQEALRKFKMDKSTNSFRDFVRISHLLNFDKEVIELFLELQRTDYRFTEDVYKFIEDIMIHNKQWEICEKYIEDALKAYTEKLKMFDELMRISKEAYNGEFDQLYRKKFVLNIRNLIEILRSSQRLEEIDIVLDRLAFDMKQRNYAPIELD